MSKNPHDALFKSTFSQVEHAAAALASILPPELVARIDFTTLVLCAGSFVDEELTDRHTDLLFSANLDERRAFLYLLYEHQSSVDPLMALRLLLYMARIWDSFVKKAPDANRIPAIFSVVLHHSPSGWSTHTSFEELLDLEPASLSALGKYVPRFSFLVDDISDETDESLRARTMTALGRLVLWCLKNARAPDRIVDGIRFWKDVLREVRRTPNGRAALRTVWQYILSINERFQPERRAHEIIAQLVKAIGPEEDTKEELVTLAERLKEEAREEGLEKGLEKGLKQGRQEALLKLLGVRFGTLPDDAVVKVRAAGVAELDVWLERVIAAPSLADALATG